MIGATRRSEERAAKAWPALHGVLEAVGAWVPHEADFAISRADGTLRGRSTPLLAKEDEAGLLNGVLFASLLPDRTTLEDGDVPFAVPLFVPVGFRRRRGDRMIEGTEVLALSVTVDGRPLRELGCLPVAGARGERRQVVLRVRSPQGKVLDEGTLRISVGVGAGPAPVLSFPDAGGATRTVRLRPGMPLPDGAPAWAASVRLDGALAPLSQRELSVCYAVASDLGGRCTARLLAQFRPLVAGRMKNHQAADAENTRSGGLACPPEDRRNDLYECLLQHLRNYVAKALAEDGEYTRDLFHYVTSCFKPAATRAMLTYGVRTGHQDATGCSVKVSELVGSLRQHAAIYRLTDPATARAHHAVHWVLARRLRDRLDAGDVTLEELCVMWERGEVPKGVRVPDLAAWEVAIAHQARHVSIDGPDERTGEVLADSISDDAGAGPGGRSGRSIGSATEDDLDLLVEPSAAAVEAAPFLALTARAAQRLAVEQADVWKEAIDRGVAVQRLLRHVMEPYATNGAKRDAADRLHAACSAGGTWRPAGEVVELWEAQAEALRSARAPA